MAPAPPEHPGHDIRLRRQTLGLSQAELATRSGIGVRTIRRVEAATGSPDSRTITRLRHTLGLPVAGAPAFRIDETRRDELVEWALDEATDMEWVAGLMRRLRRTGHPVAALPEQDLYLPRRAGRDDQANSGGP